MQFFEHQDQARGRTSLLVALFIFAVLALGAASAAATHFALSYDLKPGEPLSENHWSLVATASIATLGIIFLGSAYRTAQLSSGGIKVAETLGGTLVTAQSTDLLERRVVNVVEEIAIAAGLPAPPVYVMQNESGINAFAAGWSPDDAVIGVTKGALESLKRDQLQGVIAHEFSHILNRDCALNMRLMGVLHGIVLISVIGRILIRLGSGSRHSSSRNNGAVQFAIVGIVIWIFGSLGVLVARIIQAAVSRQREYLADASAVQFTRNPEGIAGALATIGSQSSALTSPRASETSHMLISEPGKANFLSSLDSHPPLFDRIKRVLPSWGGDFLALATPEGSVRAALGGSGERTKSNVERAREILQGSIPGLPGDQMGGVAGALILEQIGGAAVPQPKSADHSRADTATSRPRADTEKPAVQEFSLDEDGEPLPPTTAPDPLVAQARRLLASIPPALRAAAEEPFSARALILAWVLDADPRDRGTQLALIGRDVALLGETERLALSILELPASAVLPLFDVALGTLAALSDRQKATFYELLCSVSAQLSTRSYRGYCLSALALRRLNRKEEARKHTPMLIKDAIETTLGVLAYEGHDTPEQAEQAFSQGASQLGNRGKNLRPPASDQLTIGVFDRALHTLLRLPTVTRAEVLNAAEFIASSDGVLRPSEAELLRAMATCLGVAAPPAFASKNW